MKPGTNEFHIVTEWRITGLIAEMAEILTDPGHVPDWWGDV